MIYPDDSIITSFIVDGHNCIIRHIPYHQIPNRETRSFIGQKIHHPWELSGTQPTEYVPSDVTWIQDCMQFEIKSDGSCGALLWDGVNLIPYARYDIKEKSGKKIIDNDPFKITQNTKNWIACESRPVIEKGISKHWPHLRPVYEDPKQYKWHIQAFEHSKEGLMQYVVPYMISGQVITVEYMGPHFNRPNYDPINEDKILIHGTLCMDIPKELRTLDGFKKIFKTFPIIEGFVLYPENLKPYKIRANLSGIDPSKSDYATVSKEYHLYKPLADYATY